jgi:hypothetical protein
MRDDWKVQDTSRRQHRLEGIQFSTLKSARLNGHEGPEEI